MSHQTAHGGANTVPPFSPSGEVAFLVRVYNAQLPAFGDFIGFILDRSRRTGETTATTLQDMVYEALDHFEPVKAWGGKSLYFMLYSLGDLAGLWKAAENIPDAEAHTLLSPFRTVDFAALLSACCRSTRPGLIAGISAIAA
ncbi:MAG: hypothetical protein M3O22_05095 [Pseudomonadota bacterium]|nr:hypothetical protein [Pseudomonadota bacterium]